MNDNQFSIAGNMVRDPVLKTVAGGKSVLSFRLASTPRRFDQASNEWRNLDSLYLTVNCWHRLAERVAESLKAGDPLIVTGRLRMRTYEVESERRTVYEVDAQHVAPDLNRVSVMLVRGPRRYEETAPLQDAEVALAEQSVSAGPLVPLASEAAA
ncbi:hypothetical protein acdb102_33410 [Acidothermaceae bacterium B102]|nr:hypothetical protein acdb102_33410 [Acidothermaceae bacterium B102]